MIENNQIYEELKKILDIQNIKKDEDMKKHTTFKIGGKADFYVIAKKVQDIKKIVKFCMDNNVNLNIIGNGSNILVSDNGIRGIVMKIDMENIEIIPKVSNNVMISNLPCVAETEEDYSNSVYIKLESGVKLSKLAQILLKEEIEGFEFASGIPGTIGGAIRMNAGAYGKEMKDIVIETTCMDRQGNIFKLNNEEQKFSYRKSIFSNNDYIILDTTIVLNYGSKSQIKEKMDEYLKSRKEKQPLDLPSAGSTFKRGDGFITAKLIDDCGLKGYRIGGAEVSKKHAGFVVNVGNATSKDVLDLVNYIKKVVYENTNNNIELEIEIME